MIVPPGTVATSDTKPRISEDGWDFEKKGVRMIFAEQVAA